MTRRIKKPIAFVEVPWTAARAWMVAQGLERVANAIGVEYGTLRSGLSRDNLPAGTCDKLAELSCGKFAMSDFYLHPRCSAQRLELQHAKLQHAESVSCAPLLLSHEKA